MGKKTFPIKHVRPLGRIVERGPRQFQVLLYLRTDLQGKPVRYAKTLKSLKEADAHLAEKAAEKTLGTLVVNPAMRLEQLCETYMREQAPQVLRTNTKYLQRLYLKMYLYPYLGQKKVSTLTYKDFQSHYKWLLENYIGSRTGKPLAPLTVRKVHNVVKTILSFYVTEGVLQKNPAVGASVKGGRKREIVPLTVEEVRRFYGAVKKLRESNGHLRRLGPLFHLAFETGLRPSEFIGLKLTDLSLFGESPYLMVQRTVVRHAQEKGTWWADDTKTQKSRRLIPITKQLAKMLRQHIQYTDIRKRSVKEWKENGLLFPNSVGAPYYDYRIRQTFKAVLIEAGIDASKRLYFTRHTMATLALTNRLHPKVVQERLGHSSIQQTMDTYSHVIPSMQNEATEMLGSILYSPVSEILPSFSDAELHQERPF